MAKIPFDKLLKEQKKQTKAVVKAAKVESKTARRLDELLKKIQDGILVEVTRCKDCAFSTEEGFICRHPWNPHRCYPEDFCSHGEWRADR